MYVLLMEITLIIDEAYSLKDKRRVVKSVIDRSHQRYNISVAEVGNLDIINQADLAFAMVTNSRSHGLKVLNTIYSYIEASYPVEIVHQEIYDA